MVLDSWTGHIPSHCTLRHTVLSGTLYSQAHCTLRHTSRTRATGQQGQSLPLMMHPALTTPQVGLIWNDYGFPRIIRQCRGGAGGVL